MHSLLGWTVHDAEVVAIDVEERHCVPIVLVVGPEVHAVPLPAAPMALLANVTVALPAKARLSFSLRWRRVGSWKMGRGEKQTEWEAGGEMGEKRREERVDGNRSGRHVGEWVETTG